MRIEAFSEGKDPAHPEANEDRFVVLPGRAYAVIDGVTDRLGTRYDGMLAGQYGAVLVKEALEEILGRRDHGVGDARDLVPRLTSVIAAAYARHGTLDAARADTNRRFSATLALVLERTDHLELLLIGDSGVRLGLSRDVRQDKDLDLVTANARHEAWAVIAPRTADFAARERLSRRVTWSGTRQDATGLEGVLDAADLLAIEAAAIAANAHALPHLPLPDIERLVRGGIINAQGGYQNNAGSILGYSCLDGFEVPLGFVHHERVPKVGIDAVELYSDGYFKGGEGFGIAAWERAFDDVEREDPAKIGAYRSVKGTIGAIKADDRTYLGIAWRSA